MKTLYIDCGMGAAGDMLAAALLELCPAPDEALAALNAIGVPGVEYRREPSVKCGVAGTRLTVLVHGAEEAEHCPGGHAPHGHASHSDLRGIGEIVSALALSDKVKADVTRVYTLLAEAESAVHGRPVPEIHFHEVGTLDAVADVAAVCVLMDRLAPDEVIASPVHVGSGSVRCAHGVLPVPAPATAQLLRDIPIYSRDIEGELCTPTGAALLKYFVTRFGPMPVMRASAVGYGMGKKDFPQANCVRAFLGGRGDGRGTVSELSCNVDDMSAEEIGYALERLMVSGAREVYTVPVGMKKSRPGTLIRVICDTPDEERMAALLIRYTSTLGVRVSAAERYVLERRIGTLQTPYGPVRVKEAAGYGVTRRKLEYDDLARIARERDISVAEARALVENGGFGGADGNG